MLIAVLMLLGCQLAGEILRQAFSLPLPGPVIGMFLLAALLVLRGGKSGAARIPASLDTTAEALISQMGLLFVPAGVGIIAQAGLLRREWVPILAALVGSTVLGVMVTGLVMHWTTRAADRRQAAIAGVRDEPS